MKTQTSQRHWRPVTEQYTQVKKLSEALDHLQGEEGQTLTAQEIQHYLGGRAAMEALFITADEYIESKRKYEATRQQYQTVEQFIGEGQQPALSPKLVRFLELREQFLQDITQPTPDAEALALLDNTAQNPSAIARYDALTRVDPRTGETPYSKAENHYIERQAFAEEGSVRHHIAGQRLAELQQKLHKLQSDVTRAKRGEHEFEVVDNPGAEIQEEQFSYAAAVRKGQDKEASKAHAAEDKDPQHAQNWSAREAVARHHGAAGFSVGK